MSTTPSQQSGAHLEYLEAQQLLHRYCFAVDMGTVADVMALFAERCDLIVEPGGVFGGRAAVTEWYRALTTKRMAVLRHLTSNQVLSVSGDHATSKSYWDAHGDLNGEAMVAAGFYEDTMNRIDGHWRYTKKIIRIDYMVSLKEGWGGANRIKCRLIKGVSVDTAGWR